MLVGILKNNSPGPFVLISLLGALLWLSALFFPPEVNIQHPMPLYEHIILPLLKYPYLCTILGLIIMLSQAFIITEITNKNETLSKPTWVPALFYVLLMSVDNSMLTLHPALIANTFLLLSFRSFTNSYRKDEAFSNVFNVGALFAIATLFYAPFIIIFPVLGIGLFAFRPFTWREWLICLLGIGTPYLFLFAYYFWINQLSDLWANIVHYSPPQDTITYSSALYSVAVIILFILFLSIASLVKNLSGASQKKIKSTQMLIWIAVFSLFSIYPTSAISCRSFTQFIIPASVFCGEYLINVKKKWWAEFLFSLLFISIIINLISIYF